MTGKVTDIRYHGHDVLVTVDVAGSGPVQARVPGAEPPASGDEVAWRSATLSSPGRPRIVTETGASAAQR